MTTAASKLCMGCMSPLGDYIVCPNCGYDNGSPYDKQYRKPGTNLANRYTVGRLIRKNGEGAVYLGLDHSTQKRVWIREYYPHTLAGRDVLTGDILPREGHSAQYKALMAEFIDLCNDIRQVSAVEPVVPISDMVGEQGTVYAVYPDFGLVPLEKWLAQQGGRLPVGESRERIIPLLNALSNLHAKGVIHRGISSYTVYADKNGDWYIWDFCLSATRTGESELEAELFHGYSAPEQYSSTGWQGTWTDVYGAAALFYRVVSGFVPPKSTLIGEQRPLTPLLDLVMDIPANISSAVADAMNPDTDHRTQDLGAFLSSLIQTDLANTAIYDIAKVSEVKKRREEKRAVQAEKQQRGKYVALGMVVTVTVLVIALFVIMTALFPDLIERNPGLAPSNSNSGVGDDPSGVEDDSSPTTEAGTLPNFAGQKAEDVQELYGDRYSFSIRSEYNSEFEEGIVYDQAPSQGIPVAEGRTVILYVSKGQKLLVMPDLIGKTREEVADAIYALTEGEFDLPYTSFDRHSSEDVDPGTVISTNPKANEEFDPQTTRITIIFKSESSVSEASQVEQAHNSTPSASTPSSSSSPNNPSEAESRNVRDDLPSWWTNR